jgi:hypothetical protein
VECLKAVVRDDMFQVRTKKVIHLTFARAVDKRAEAFGSFLRRQISGEGGQKIEKNIGFEVLPEAVNEAREDELVLGKDTSDCLLSLIELVVDAARRVERSNFRLHSAHNPGVDPDNLLGESVEHLVC